MHECFLFSIILANISYFQVVLIITFLQVVVVGSLSCVWLFATPWTAAHQASLSITSSQSLFNSCPSSRWWHPTASSFCHSLLLLPSIFPSVRVFSSEPALRIRWPQHWSFSISVTCEKPEGWPFWNPHSVVSEQPHAVNHVEALGDEATSWLSPENVSGQDHLHSVMIWDLSVLDSSSPAVLTQWEKD